MKWSLTSGQNLTKPEELRSILARDQEVWLRVKVKGLIITHEDSSTTTDGVIPVNKEISIYKHALRVVHCPFVSSNETTSASESAEIARSVG